MKSIKDQATQLRDKGYSYSMIKEKLGVSKSTLSNWFADRPYRPNAAAKQRVKAGPYKSGLIKHQKRLENIAKINKQAEVEVGKITKRDLWMLGIGLYMGEGAKSIESVRIINSDPGIIRLSMRWFREVIGLSDENFSLSLHLYPDNNEAQSIKYWSKITNLNQASFKQSSFDRRQNKKNKFANKLPHGTLQIRIKANGDPKNGVQLFRRIKGWSAAIFKQM